MATRGGGAGAGPKKKSGAAAAAGGPSSSAAASVQKLEAENSKMDERLAMLRAQLAGEKAKWEQVASKQSAEGSIWRSAKPVPVGTGKKCTPLELRSNFIPSSHVHFKNFRKPDAPLSLFALQTLTS